MPEYRFINAIVKYGPTWYASRDPAIYYNAFAAMPSLHIGWTVLFGIVFYQTGKLPLRVWGMLYSTLTFFAITMTVNHYVIGAVDSGVLMLSSFLLYEPLQRYGGNLRPLMAVPTLFRHRPSNR